MKRSGYAAFLLLRQVTILILLSSGCEHRLPSNPVRTPGGAASFGRDVAPIFNARCAVAGCHDPGTRQVGLALNTWANTLRGSLFGEVVVPFAPERSTLVDMISGRGVPGMPFGQAPLDSISISRISEWIRQGAVNDSGRIAFDDGKARLYAAHQGEGLVSILDVETLQVARVIGAGDAGLSLHMAVAADGKFWYATDRERRRFSKFEARTNRLLGVVSLSQAAGSCVLTPNGETAYVGYADSARGSANGVVAVNTLTMRVDQVIPTQRGPHHLAVDAVGRRVFVAHEESDWITIVDTQSNAVVQQFPLERGRLPSANGTHRPSGLVISPSGTELWVSCSGSSQMRIYDPTNGALLDSVITLAAPRQPAMSNDGKTIYVPCRDAEQVMVIDAADRLGVKNLSSHDIAQPEGSAVSPDGRFVFVASSNARHTYRARRVQAARGNVVVIDVARNQIVKTIEVQDQPRGICASR